MMKTNLKILLVSFIALVYFPNAIHAQQTAQEFVFKINYLLYLPESYEQDKTQRWPLVIFLHGKGESGDDIEKVKINGIPKNINEGKKYPFIVVSPLCPNSHWDISFLNRLLDHIIETCRVDENRIYLTGLSMGGFGTWEWACKNPERFAAIVPICGGGKSKDVWKIRHLPVWAFHGGKDSIVPMKFSEEMITKLKEIGSSPKFTVYPEAGHNSWVYAYDTEELYDWMLSQKRDKDFRADISHEIRNRYVGTYLINEKDKIVIIEEKNKLMTKAFGKENELVPEGDNMFYVSAWWNNMVIFHFDKEDRVSGFDFYTGDSVINVKKVKE